MMNTKLFAHIVFPSKNKRRQNATFSHRSDSYNKNFINSYNKFNYNISNFIYNY